MNYGARRPPGRSNNARAIIIGFGPFTGFKGEVVSVELERVMVRIILEQGRSILVELDADMIGYDESDTFNPLRRGALALGFSV
jgi:hypothetical protein